MWKKCMNVTMCDTFCANGVLVLHMTHKCWKIKEKNIHDENITKKTIKWKPMLSKKMVEHKQW
jgi:hypothetical protein